MTTPNVEIGIHLSNRAWALKKGDRISVKSTLLSMAEQIEKAGYHSVWIGDSVVAKPRYEALTLLAALGARTERVKIGVTVLLPALRHPVHLAHQTATIDQISDGRLMLAFGAGGAGERGSKFMNEWDALGVPARERGPRMDETIDILRRLWKENKVTHQGRFFQFENVSLEPKPVRPEGIPIWTVCGHGVRPLVPVQVKRVVERADGWMTAVAFPEDCRETVKVLTATARRAGRDPASIHSACTLRVNINPNREQAREEFETHLLEYYNNVKFWKEEGGHHLWGPYGSAEYVRERMDAFVEAGIQTFAILFTAPDQMRQLKEFTEKVWPHFS
jgi:alkanesulfonate monooxygenase SsuD/methylene tetrahydromethanopterin reductase-like flavin-dependent oxidoreductase (luciferase family)